jgi:cyclic beta-1,2-glucan synthetase
MNESLASAPAPVEPPAGNLLPEPHGPEPLRAELFGLEHLEAHARFLAAHARAARVTPGEPLIQRFFVNSRALVRAHRAIAEAYKCQETFGSDAEWLLDNFHIVADALAEVRTDLPGGYYKLLPKLIAGPLTGFPRVYALTLELVAHCDSCLDETHLTRFVQAYQTVTTLTIGELWAVPIMLRLVLIDNLRRLAEQILFVRGERQAARKLVEGGGWGRERSERGFSQHNAPSTLHPFRSDPFLIHCLEQLRERGPDGSATLEWLERHFGVRGVTTADVLRREQQRQAANQVSIGNCVTSLRILSTLDWMGFFENTSLVEAELKLDPSGVYVLQDFATRDRYRQAVEKLARGSDLGEIEVARQVVALASRHGVDAQPDEFRQGGSRLDTSPRHHLGYYLIDQGRRELEAALQFRPSLRDWILRVVLDHPQSVFFGGLALFTTLFVTILFAYARGASTGTDGVGLLALVILTALLPASELAVGIINSLVVRFVPPRVLPKLQFKEGIPAEFATFVVVPSMLVRPESAALLLERLEVHYLSNPDPQLRFALLTDYADAPAEHMPEDESYLRAAMDGIQALNKRYCAGGPNRFYLCHRRRQWNPVQGVWMAWERKRGKLLEFNRLLRGALDTSFTTDSGDLQLLSHVRFVITLDVDTQIPRETAQRLVATLAHPLNRARFDVASGRVVAGYGVLQPRVTLEMTAARRSLFARVFSGSAGIDPYVTAVSDVYQDLFGIGSFTGKGIYDVDAFVASAGHAFPENHVLSHDLIEGNYARCGLVSDIELLDGFPASYPAYAQREHRWARGDWQILRWLFPRVPSPDGSRRPNTLPAVERWKVFDNLRRSLVPVALVTLLTLGWTILPGWAGVWTATVLTVLAWPLLAQLANQSARAVRGLYQGARPGDMFLTDLANTAGQVLLEVVFLCARSVRLLDAAIRTLARLYVTRRQLLEWETAATAERRFGNSFLAYCRSMWLPPVLALSVAWFVYCVRPGSFIVAGPLLLAWLLSPVVAFWISQPLPQHMPELTDLDRRYLHRLARKTWSFFETYVDAQDNWLPPDNFQADPKGVVAHRTSPTNIGLYLLSCVTAHDFGYLSLPALLERIEKTFATFDKLERLHGHFYNWYDTQSLRGLHPIYVSTVDSGNLMACLLTLKHALAEKAEATIPCPAFRQGLEDTWALVEEDMLLLQSSEESPPPEVIQWRDRHLEKIRTLLTEDPGDFHAWDEWLRRMGAEAKGLAEQIRTLAERIKEVPEGLQRWARLFVELVEQRRSELLLLAPWLKELREVPAEIAASWGRIGSSQSSEQCVNHSDERGLLARLIGPISLADLRKERPALLDELEELDSVGTTSEVRTWLKALVNSVGATAADELLARCERLAERSERLASEMDFQLLYNESRNLFAVGYNMSHGRLDNAHYDLLASEASLTSFLAVARGDVPKKHWFQLGRPLTRAARSLALLSWGGTMFEYLMPRLLLPTFPDTLLTESQRAAVAKQIEYGRQCRVPWGISESAFSAVDGDLNYQYQAFGVPGLGLKRGLAKDLVIAPYATALAVMIVPGRAVQNMRRLEAEGAAGDHGFFEAIDYTRDRLHPKRRSVTVKCFMAHHQGMSLLALANCLLGNLLARRFYNEPMVRATELLLQERVPHGHPLVQPPTGDTALPHATPEVPQLMSRRLTTPHTAHPRTHLLSSGQYTVMLTNAGAGWSTWRSLDVTRWREDRTRDAWGQFCYVRDPRSGKVWSAGYHPACREPEEYEVVYSIDKAEFRRLDEGIETHLEVTVSPETHAEVRRLTLTNHGNRPRELELTSYIEVVLGPHAADLAHPAFGKLFLETEYLPAEMALLCRRRPRSPEQKPVWGVHVLAADGPIVGAVQFETDRAKFLGRGRSPADPAALEGDAILTGTTGPVLDPIFSLRCRVRVPPESAVRVAFTTAMADTREEAAARADHYHDFPGVTRAFELAWAHSQVELRHLQLSAEVAHLFQRLAAHIIYAGPALRAAPGVLTTNLQGAPGLWRHGISGDNPIVLARIGEADEMPLVRQLLSAHAFWRLKGLTVDLVILNDHESGYFEDLQQQLQSLVRGSDDRGLLDKPGGVFVRKGAHMVREDQILLQAVARCVFIGNRGSLASQIDRMERLAAPVTREGQKTKDKGQKPKRVNGQLGSSSSRPPEKLLFANGLGGFSPDGREYVLFLSAKDSRERHFSTTTIRPALPPAPWINVVSNPLFGFLVSERGAGYTWADNSQTNRLTPWNNDAVSDPPGEAIYLRDEATGDVWSPTPSPSPCRAPYLVRHGNGYTLFEHHSHGIRQELLILVPPSDRVKLISLRLKNLGRQPLNLSATFYAEWVLGTVRDQAPLGVITDIDEETGALLARNPFNADFGNRIAFADVNARPRSFTADRTEFLGRNGTAAAPDGLGGKPLSGTTGPALDPCVALRTTFDLRPGGEKEVVFLLGQADNIEGVRRLVNEYQRPGQVTKVFNDVVIRWERVLTAVQVKTPNPAFDLLVNRWLLYQVLSCRVWGRSAFYQSGGAYGFRDQLQDVLALVHAAPAEARAQILRAAGRQFREGDVQHWWHPPSGAGVRTRFSDDFLWLPFVAYHYVSTTGDTTVLDELVPFLQAPTLREDQEEDYRVPEVSDEHATVYEHCLRAIEHGCRFGAHDLPLMGAGDWNDGMNRVGSGGRGESVWNAWFLSMILRDFADVAESRGEDVRSNQFRALAAKLVRAVEEQGWDGRWYRRAYFDNGTPLGSAQNDECRIDSLVQSWAAIAGGDPDRARQAMAAVEEFLVRPADATVLLFTPPFDKGNLEPGYIKGYVPGIRENGGQYTHAAAWVVQAVALLGDGKRAMELFDMLNPIHHGSSAEKAARYRVEPYVMAGDIYGDGVHAGRGGWTWYTGSAGWLYRIAIGDILGFKRRGDKLIIEPCIPDSWPGFEITYRHGSATYQIVVENPNGAGHGVRRIVIDGQLLKSPEIGLSDDGKNHLIQIVMGD